MPLRLHGRWLDSGPEAWGLLSGNEGSAARAVYLGSIADGVTPSAGDETGDRVAGVRGRSMGTGSAGLCARAAISSDSKNNFK